MELDHLVKVLVLAVAKEEVADAEWAAERDWVPEARVYVHLVGQQYPIRPALLAMSSPAPSVVRRWRGNEMTTWCL